MRKIDRHSQQLLVNSFYRIGALYYKGTDRMSKEQRRKHFFKGVRNIMLEIWKSSIKEPIRFEMLVIPLSSSEEKMTLEVRGDIGIGKNAIRGYELELSQGKFEMIKFHLFEHLVDPADESKGRTWQARFSVYPDGINKSRFIIQSDGTTNETESEYEDECIDTVFNIFLTKLLVSPTI